MCAAKGHCDRVLLREGVVVGVMCAAKGHCDKLQVALGTCERVGVMCAAKGHCDIAVSSRVDFPCRSHVCRERALRPFV